MKTITLFTILFSLVFYSCTSTNSNSKNKENINYLRQGFKTPPVEARPRALWDWVDGNFSLDEITHEMEEAVAKGMGGFDIWDVRSVVDEKNIVPEGPAFMSDEYLIGIVHAINEAERLGLDLGLIVASGWNAGGPWTKPNNQTMGLFRSNIEVSGPTNINQQIPFPTLPDVSEKGGYKQYVIIPRGENGLPIFYTDVQVLAIPVSRDSSIIRMDNVINISDKMDIDGNLNWDAPKGNWKVTRYVCTNTGQPMISSTPNSGGPMIDHFNPEATVAHINYFIDKIEDKLGKPIGESGLTYFYTDSYEVQGLLWTPALITEFEKRMDYSMIPYLPIFDGYVVENSDITRRFLYDYRRVWSDLIIESHYQKATEICESHGIGFVAEAAGPGAPIHNCPFESLKSSGSLSFPRGEFWHVPNKNDYWKEVRQDSSKMEHFLNSLQVLKGVASASHIYNQKYVEAEAFTGIHIYVEGPGDLKPTADRAFCEGLNRINFHTWPHTPKEAGEPGWSYSFGTLMHETRAWWPMAKPWMDYLGRCSYMLQQGNFHGDVLYFFGDSTPNFVPAKHINASLGFGYDYDVTNSDIILNKLAVKDGKITLPHGQYYEILVLPEEEYMVYPVLEKIGQLIEDGATVIGPKPTKGHGLKNWKEEDAKVATLANSIWGDCNGTTVTESKYGKGKIVWGKTLREVLNDKKVSPDFDFKGNVENTNLDFIHRKTDVAEIFFVRNASKSSVNGQAEFRVTGMQPELWDPVSGKMNPMKVYSDNGETTKLPLSLNVDGSVFVVFTAESNNSHFTTATLNNIQIFPIENSTTSITIKQCNNELAFIKNGNYSFTSVDNETTNITVEDAVKSINIEGSWKVNFPKNKKGVGDIILKNLQSWAQSDIFDIKFFSGIASYEKEINIPENIMLDKYIIVLKLGTVRELAHVYVNGKDAGVSWQKPNKAIISAFIKPGINTIKIEVANTWHNRLCGDARLPDNERISRSNVVRLPNPWMFEMEKIPFDDGEYHYELQDAGLLGPVTINFVRKL